MTVARLARDADDFVMLADCLSAIELTEDQRRRFYAAMQPADDPQARMMEFWAIADQIAAYRDRETETILRLALEIALERYGERGAEFSANTLIPLLPPHRQHLAGEVIQHMRSRLEATGREPSRVPSRKGSKVRTYRLHLS